jgi:hypothetical protein
MAVVFETPGYIDIRSFTTFGVNSKPNSPSPIGHFGTGLKYAIAVLARLKIPVTLYIGSREYSFYTQDNDFRGKEFAFVRMYQRKWLGESWSRRRSTPLPFTTELGKDWELWQAYRELHSNTLDEGGTITEWEVSEEAIRDLIRSGGGTNKTHLVVYGLQFAEAYRQRRRTFLPGALPPAEADGATIQVLKAPSEHLYWRGMRVMDFDKKQPSIFTWNILQHMPLTEDRTLKYTWEAQFIIANYVAQSNDPQLIEAVIKATDKVFESRLDFEYMSTLPSETFKRVVREHQRLSPVRAGIATYFNRYADPPPERKMTFDILVDNLREWAHQGYWEAIKSTIINNQDLFLEILDKAQVQKGQTHHEQEEPKEVRVPSGRENVASDGVGTQVEERPF